MPGPIIRNPNPRWLNDPSVMDSTSTKALRALMKLFGADDPGGTLMVPVAPMATIGFGKGIRGFELPGGKFIKKDAEGVARIVEGDAQKGLRTFSEKLGPHEAPVVRGGESPVDAAAASVKTPQTEPPALIGKQGTGKYRASRQMKLNESMVRDIRKRYDAGESILSINKDYPDLSYPTLLSTAKRHSWVHVKD